MSLALNNLIPLLEPLLHPLQEAVILADRHGMVMGANRATYSLFRLPNNGQPLSLANLNGHNLRSSMIRAGLAQSEGEQHHCEAKVSFEEELRVDGQSRWVKVDSQLVALPEAKGYFRMIVLRDITAEKRLSAVMGPKDDFGFVTEDPDMRRLIERLRLVADTSASVLLQGESGTGKTLLAREVHRLSSRSDRPFVEVNCGAIPASLIETELFGHVKGAFTGALKDRPGRFKAADGGTLFLDEIGELPPELQPKLLRVLQDGEYEPVGSDQTLKADVRLVAASNRDLRDSVDNGEFRADLYYRIAVVSLLVPALRERPGDIPLLIELLQQRLVTRGYPDSVRFDQDAMRSIMNYPWPGNVRELANAVEHCLICAENGVVTRMSLPDSLREYCSARMRLAQVEVPSRSDERTRIETALTKADGNKTLAAQFLGIDRTTLWRRMQRLGMD